MADFVLLTATQIIFLDPFLRETSSKENLPGKIGCQYGKLKSCLGTLG